MTESRPEFYARTSALPSSDKTSPFLNRLSPQACVLDFGCGSGRWAVAFQRDRPDLTIDVLDMNLHLAPLIGEDWKGARYTKTFEEFRPEKPYDGIWAFAALFFLVPESFATVLATLSSALKSGGVLFFTMVEPGARTHFYGMNECEIRTALAVAGLICDSIVLHHDSYGTQQKIIPTYHVTAHRA